MPTTPNHCPVCGGWVFDNTGSLVHGLRSKKLAKIVDAYRVDLIDSLFAERGGRDALDVVSRIAIENYGLVCAQHKTIEARLDQDGLFTQQGRRRSAFDMLKSISETIDRLRAALPPILTRSSALPGVAAMPVSALELARDLLRRLKAGETLSDFDRGRLDVLRAAMRDEVRLPPDEPARPTYRTEAGPTIVEPASTSQPVSSRAHREPGTTCSYCNQSPDACAALQESNVNTWETLHGLDPAVQKKKDDEATAVMHRMVGEGVTWHR
ncbi:MAG: hypothetical protein ABL986_23455 [Vicinamibacterales bacterium]